MELHRVRRRLTALAALTALTSTVLQLGATAGAVEDVTSERLAGQDRFATAAEIADAAFPDGSDTVLVASGRSFPDALAGAALGLPILLTEPGSLPAATASALDDLGAEEAIILGGTAAVSEAVEDDVAEHATVTRLAGDDRYETAAEIATSVGAAAVGEIEGLRTAIIATGKDFADALAGGPLATGGDDVFPVLLVENTTPGATADALNELDIEQVLILGGTAAVSPAVETQLEAITGNPAVRLAGNNRYATAVDIAEFALDTLDFPGDEALLANGVVFADALAGGPLGGVREAPLLLTTAATLSDESEAFMEDHSSTIDTITTLGGTAAVSASTASSAETAAETPSDTRTNEDITVTPTANANQANGSTREYTATGLGTTVVDLVLVPCNNVTTTSAGETRFVNSNANSIADRTQETGESPDEASTPARIASVNGSDLPPDPTDNDDYEANITPENGSVTFEVAGPSAAGAASACVIPVVFVDDNVDHALNAPAANPAAPSEEFGTGGSVTFSPSAQGAGQFTARNVQEVDKARDVITACAFVTQQPREVVNTETGCTDFRYDANDTFQLNSTPITMSEFEARISPDDDISGTYADVASSRSVFNLNDEAPTAPQMVTAGSATSRGATISWRESETPTVNSYRVYRAVRSASSTTCPASTAGSTLLTTPDIPDATPTEYDPAETYSYEDTTAAQATTYCYNVVAVDDGDEGTPSAGAAATTTGTAGQPTITSVTATSPNDTVLNQGDVHLFTFSEPMNIATSSATYDVRDNDIPNQATGKITCGGNADCTWTSSTTLRVVITDTPALTEGLTNPGTDNDLDYPLTITATTFTDAGGSPVDLQRSDTQIERT